MTKQILILALEPTYILVLSILDVKEPPLPHKNMKTILPLKFLLTKSILSFRKNKRLEDNCFGKLTHKKFNFREPSLHFVFFQLFSFNIMFNNLNINFLTDATHLFVAPVFSYFDMFVNIRVYGYNFVSTTSFWF